VSHVLLQCIKSRVLKLIPCSTKKFAEQTVPASVISYPALLTMEKTIFKLVLWDRAQDFARSYERNNTTVVLSVLFLNAVQHHIIL